MTLTLTYDADVMVVHSSKARSQNDVTLHPDLDCWHFHTEEITLRAQVGAASARK